MNKLPVRGYLLSDLSRSLGMFVSTFLDWKILTVLVWLTSFFLVVLTVLVWYIVALLLWDIATVGILDTIAVLIWYLGALSIFFLLSSVFSNWSTLRGIVPFTSGWIFNPNLFSWGWFFPMLLTSLFFLCKAFIFDIGNFDWSVIVFTFFFGFFDCIRFSMCQYTSFLSNFYIVDDIGLSI